MTTLIDTSVWVDFTRHRSPQSLKRFIEPIVTADGVALAEPIMFEVMRHIGDNEAASLRRQFRLVPVLETPPDLWRMAIDLGQRCSRSGIAVGPLDLLIATVAIHHQADLVTFDRGFERIASVSALRVNVLGRPAVG